MVRFSEAGLTEGVEEHLIDGVLNGIDYAYEVKHGFDVADAGHRQYAPDFYLPQRGIYIEHFGIARDGSTARHIDRQTYAAAMEWKRSRHREPGTTLIEILLEHYEGTFLDPAL